MIAWSSRFSVALISALCGAAALVGSAPPPALAASTASTSPYQAGTTGFDVSYGQCSSYRTIGGSFGVVGVNDGRPFTGNPCFGAEYDAANSGGRLVSIYMNMKAPVGRTGPTYTSYPNSCGNDRLCQAHNYGWNAAADAFARAGSRKASTWWLDVETANSWSGQSSINVATIQGAVDYFLTQPALGVATVGIYSTPSMWRTITGGYPDSRLPVWVPSAAGTCGTGFTGGPVWLVQTASGQSNGDRAC